VIVVNDASTDKTPDNADEVANTFSNFFCLNISESMRNKAILHGKQNSVHFALEKAKGEFIVQLDADCKALPDFLQSYSNYFSEGFDFVFGVTDIDAARGCNGKIQRADLHYLMTIAALSAQMSVPLSCMGNNMGYSKKAYQEIGGYNALGANLVEDYQLMLAFIANRKKVTVMRENKVMVYTRTEKDFATFVRQRVRWARGLSLPNGAMKILLVVRLFMTLLFWYGVVFCAIGDCRNILLSAVIASVDSLIYFAGAIKYTKKGILSLLPLWIIWFYWSPAVISAGFLFTPASRWK
jgi:cellulose synthase/poly-beta-1,6-N-acetylglucosamine synthase-like glycosyltransferase